MKKKQYSKNYSHEWYLKNQDFLKARSKNYAKNNPEQRALTQLKYACKQKGITVEQYYETLEQQNGVCAICGKPETATFRGTTKRLAIDHCHKSNKFRGLLCFQCNTLLGKFNEDISQLILHNHIKEAQYLLKHCSKKTLLQLKRLAENYYSFFENGVFSVFGESPDKCLDKYNYRKYFRDSPDFSKSISDISKILENRPINSMETE